MLVLFTLPAFLLVNSYAYIFFIGFRGLPRDLVFGSEADIYWISLGITAIAYLLFGGGLVRLGIPSILRPLRRVDRSIETLGDATLPEELRSLLAYLYVVPRYVAWLALAVYFAHEVWFASISYLGWRDLERIGLFALIDICAGLIFFGLVYSISEFCCGYLRVQIKRMLSAYDESGNDITVGRTGGLRLLYLLFVGATSIIALIVFIKNPGERSIVHAIEFSAITFIVCGTLAFIYFYTWAYSLSQISDATHNVASGGRGYLPLLSNDREMIDLAANFDAATYEIHTIRNYLTELVDEKTRTLSEAYNELKQLKSRQDGDYYLTSNLIESLTEMRPESDTVVIDSLVKQYKTFEFMGHTREIGGDMNACYPLLLQGEKYTLVVNADAMGKSLQGAGGVLVLGSALRSLIERTHITDGLRTLSPERWLKNAFLELHRLFANFNGGMMASTLCLLIHDNSGYTVMVNAEHPRGILLRGASSQFISHHEGLRKLGNTAVKGRLWVDTFLLKPRDVVILGSDGRDDVVVGYDGEGQPIINEDDRKILDIVRTAQGDLPRIFIGIRNNGEIIDDISLVRIEYTGKIQKLPDTIESLWNKYRTTVDAAERLTLLRRIVAQQSDYMPAWQALFTLHLKNNEWVEAAAVADSLVRLRPDRDFFLLTAGLIYYRLGQFEKALNFADRLTLRNWQEERYLVLLGKIYEARGDLHGMKEAGLLLIELEPEHAYGKALLAAGAR